MCVCYLTYCKPDEFVNLYIYIYILFKKRVFCYLRIEICNDICLRKSIFISVITYILSVQFRTYTFTKRLLYFKIQNSLKFCVWFFFSIRIHIFCFHGLFTINLCLRYKTAYSNLSRYIFLPIKASYL